MQADLTTFTETPELAANRDRLAASGIDIRAAKPGDIVPLLDFVRTEFSPDWHREASDLLRDQFVAGSHSIGLIVARRGNEVLGYAQHRHERFGPFGVRSDQRGNGVGGVILATTLLEMRQRALHTAWFLWTDANAARLYSRFGFEQVRQFSILELHLDDCSPTNAAMTPGAIIGT